MPSPTRRAKNSFIRILVSNPCREIYPPQVDEPCLPAPIKRRPPRTQIKLAFRTFKSSSTSNGYTPLANFSWKTRMHLHHHRKHIGSIRALPCEVSPLQWWRIRGPRSLRRSDVRILRGQLLRTEAMDDPDWFRAATGDAAAAIGVAMRTMHTTCMTNPSVDAALSAVLCCALEGDPAASAVIRSALNRRSLFDPRCSELSRIWRKSGAA